MYRVGIVFALMTLLAICGNLSACTGEKAMEITVSPNVLNIESGGGAFTIHTDIKYDTNLDVKVYLNNRYSVPVLSTFADSRGELVVRCDISDVKEIVSEGPATVKLTVDVTHIPPDTHSSRASRPAAVAGNFTEIFGAQELKRLAIFTMASRLADKAGSICAHTYPRALPVSLKTGSNIFAAEAATERISCSALAWASRPSPAEPIFLRQCAGLLLSAL